MIFKILRNPEKELSKEELVAKMGQNFVYHQSSQPLYNIRVLLKNLTTEPELYVNKIEKRIYKIDKLIEFLKDFEKLKVKNLAKIHAASVVDKQGRGLLFGALQDVGKTTLSLLLTKDGYGLISDDTVLLSKNGKIYRTQKKAGIFPHKSNIRGLSISRKDKVEAWFKYHFIARFTFLHQIIYPNLRVDYEKIGKVKEDNSLDKVFILEKGSPSITRIDYQAALNKILVSSIEGSSMPPKGFPTSFFNFYCFANNISPTIIADAYREILGTALINKECFLMKGKSPFDFYELLLRHEKERT